MAVESPDPQEQQLDTSTHSLKPSNSEAAQTMSESGPSENPVNGIHSVNGVGSGGPSGHNVTEAQQQMQQTPIANGVPHGYPYPPPPGSGFSVGPPPEMFQQGDAGASGPRMMQPLHYPYPPQPGHQGPPGPPTGYVYPTMMPPPPPHAGGVSPSSPTSAMSMPPYGYGMWYPPHPGMPMQPPPGVMPPQNSMQPIPVPMGHYPPNGYPPNAQTNGDNKPSTDGNNDPQQAQGNGQSGGLSWVPGPGGLPPKEVAKNIPCRYFPDCRFGASCWFLHPGSDVPNGHPPHAGDKQQQPDGQPPRAFFQGQLPPPVQYGPSGPWDPSSSTPTPNSNQSDPGKSPYPSQNGTPAPSGYGLMYAPYPYGPNGYPPMYPIPPHPHQQPNPNASQSPSQAPQVPTQPSPHDHTQNLQQNPQSLHSTPHANSPSPNPPPMYPMNGAGWYPPGAYPPPPHHMQPAGMNSQPMSPGQTMPGSLPLSPVSPPQGSNPLAMNMPPHSMSPMGAPNVPPQPMQQSGHPGPVPYPISPPYTNAPLQTRSPNQSMPPLSPPNHPGSPSALYGGQSSVPPTIPVMQHGQHHSRRESMSSMSAVPMGTVLGPHLDGNTNMDGSRSPPSAFREMGESVGRRRGGHSSRGSWSSTGGFGPSSRKPPCAFYPAGKCKNGDMCRFPHVMPDENAPISPVSPRGGYSGSFGRTSRRPTILGPIEDKLAEMSVKEVDGAAENGDAAPRPSGFSKPYNNSSPKMRGGRPPTTSTPSTPVHRQNNHNQHNQPQANQQKLPSADDFPVLGGTATPPHAHGNGHSYGSAWGGPTAAQVLKGSISSNKKASGSATANGIAGDGSKELKAGSEEEQTSE